MTQEDREPQMLLSFLGGVLTFQCSAPKDSGNQRGSELTFSRLSFQRDVGSFSKTHDEVAVINRNSSLDVDIVKCSSVLDVRKRITRPCVLLTQRMKRDRFKYSLLTLNSLNTWEPHLEFKLPYRMRDNVAILQGPTVLWSYGGVAFYTSLQAGEVRQIPTKPTLNLVGLVESLNPGTIFIICPQTPSKSTGQSDTVGISTNFGYFLDDGQVGLFDGDLIVPHAYSSITQCIFVVSAEEVNGVLKSTVVAATSANQLVYFENGIPREVCKLPFEEPVDIQMANTGRNGCLFVLSFNQGHVCAIWMDTFQVASCWSGVSFLHVDDFLGCGTDQILLVFEVQSLTGCPLDNFLITDLCGTTYSRGVESREGEKTSDTVQENLILTVNALESRLQSGLTLLQDLQRDVRVKERVLLQSVKALTDVVSGTQHVLTPPEQDGLVSLWDEDEESEDEAVDEKMQVCPVVSPTPPPLLVDKLWHRIMEDHLVVGVIFTAESVIPVDGVSLSILTATGQSPAPAVVQTHGQASWFPTPGLPPRPEPAAKRSRGDGASQARDSAPPGRLAVTAVTALTPLLSSGCVKCTVMLHYELSQGSSASPVVVQCGQVPVDMWAEHQPQLLNNCKLTTDEAREDLLSLLAVLDRWVLLIDSPDHSLGDVSVWIQRSMRCERLEISPQYLLSNSAGPSAVMLFHWQQNTPFRGELSVSCSQFRLLQFLESLCGFLPASCSIRPLRNQGGGGAAPPPASCSIRPLRNQGGGGAAPPPASCSIRPLRNQGGGGAAPPPALSLALSLERELLSLKEGLSALLRGAKEEEEEERKSGRGSHLEVPDPGCAEEVQRSREQWERDRERSSRRLSPLVDMARYSSLTHSLAQGQLEGDVVALLEIQRTLIGSALQ